MSEFTPFSGTVGTPTDYRSKAGISLGELIRVRGLQLSSPAFMSSAYTAMIYKQLGAFIFGGLASFSLTSITKITTGQLRPHFLATCLPDPTSFDCENGYITNYSCTGHPEDVLDARMSFYSENASLGMYCMVYLVLYIQAGSWGQKIWLLRPTIQLLFLSLALLTGYIRVLDHWHHPWPDNSLLQGPLSVHCRPVSSLHRLHPPGANHNPKLISGLGDSVELPQETALHNYLTY
uniref:Phosphatidic acid phosphatase type 2/haloperoxidase domain-containing protein n=1 Tax=Capra hircus TaxID=9925 RepID=A0A8C2QSL6_CAPHI